MADDYVSERAARKARAVVTAAALSQGDDR